jgi:hypothetical protein
VYINYTVTWRKQVGRLVVTWSMVFLGIAALTFALLMSARMGIFQETLYRQFGKHSKEALFYNVSNFLNSGKGNFPIRDRMC